MATMSRPIELIPPAQQVLWGWPAVLNFALGGLGAGLYVAAVVAAGFERSFAVVVASWLGPALVLLGFAAVAAEAGRPFRGPRVLTRVRTSWMSRELWLGGAFIVLVAADLAFPLRPHRIEAVVAALLLALAQGFIVRRARGVIAWDMPLVPLLFLLSALLSGAGGFLVIEAARGAVPPAAFLGAVMALLVGGFIVWGRYLGGSRDDAFLRAIEPLGDGPPALFIARGGYLLPFVLLALGASLPAVAPAALAVAGALMIAAQCYAKARLILSAGHLRPITLSLRIPRRPS
jgi:formate-dependent nitrite reductase membrane component NrfD